MSYKLKIPPDSAGYTVSAGAMAAQSQLEGGLSRFRADKENPASRVMVQWTVSPDKYRYLRAFYHTTKHGALPFLIDLVLDESTPTEYEAHFIPGTWNLREQKGQSYTVSTELEVVPTTPVDLTYEEGIVIDFDNTGMLLALAVLIPLFGMV